MGKKFYGTEKQQVLKWLEEKGRISSIEAYEELGILRLSAIIHELRDEYDIMTIRKKKKDMTGKTHQAGYYQFYGELKEKTDDKTNC